MRTSEHKFSGVGVALITPFKQNKDVDFEALKQLLDHVSSGGVDYLVVMGTTAESPTINAKEKSEILEFVKANNPRSLPIVLGLGGNCTSEVIDTMDKYNLEGVDALLSVTPYYNRPSQEGMFAHYSEIAKASPVPILLYNVPSRTGVNMSAKTSIELAKAFPEKIVGIKEASGIVSQTVELLRDRPEGFAVISGDDVLTVPLISLGADGVISVSGNVYSEKVSQMTHSALEGDFSRAASLSLELFEGTELLFAEGNPAGAKAALALKGIIENELRLPLIKASDELKEKIAQQIEKYNL